MENKNPANDASETLTHEDVYAICQAFPQIEGASRRGAIIRRLNRLSAAVEAIKNETRQLEETLADVEDTILVAANAEGLTV